MTAFNVVRFRVKPDREQDFVAAHQAMPARTFAGLHKASLVKTGERTYCFIGEWNNFDSIAAARSSMIAFLDDMRDMLEDLGGGLGVTDPVSGTAVFETH